MAITFWGNPGNLIESAASAPTSSFSFRMQQQRFSDNHLWATFQTPGSTYVNGAVNTLTLMLSSQDRLGEVWNYAIPVTTINSKIGFAGLAIYSSVGNTSSGAIFWYEPTTSDPNGPYAIKYQPLTYVFDLSTVVSGQTATPPAISLGAVIELTTVSSIPRMFEWTYSNNVLQVFTSLDGSAPGTVDVYVQNFSAAGVALNTSTLVFDDIASNAAWGTLNSGTSTVPFGTYGVCYEDAGATRSLIVRSLDPMTGALGSPTTITTPYADIGGFQVRQYTAGDFFVAVSGVTSGGANSITVYKTNASMVVSSSSTIALTSPFSDVRIQSDRLTGDKVVLAYNNSGTVRVAQYDNTGALLSDDIVPGFTSYDRLRVFQDGRFEIVGRVQNGDNNVITTAVYDTRSAAINLISGGTNDSLAGTAFNDTIDGGAGDDKIVGGAGNDSILGGTGNNYIDGGDGNDTITGGSDDDTIEGGNGNDSLDGGAGNNTISYIDAVGSVGVNLGLATPQNTGAAGTDTLVNFTNVQGSAFDDSITGTAAANSLSGNGGADFMGGLAGADTLDGGAGNDMARYDLDAANGGSAGVVVNLSANAVNFGGVVAAGTARDGFGDTDTLISIEEARGGIGNDTLIGGAGYNFFQGRGGADTYDGGNSTAIGDDFGGIYFPNGFNWVDYRQDGGTSGVVITLTNGSGGNSGGTGTDTFGNAETFTNINAIRGSAFADSIVGNSYFSLVQTLQGNDTVNGGGGYDVADYSRDATYGGTGAVVVNLSGASVTVGANVVAAGTARDGWGGTDTLSNIERAYGTGGADAFYGNNWDNQFRGFAGNDTMVGGDGFDDFRPGLDIDLVDGTAGANGDQSHDDRDRVTYNDLTPGTGSMGLGVIVNLSSAAVTFETWTVAASTARDTGAWTDTLIDIERVRGTNGRDYFVGSSTANLREERFEGLGGNDYIDGGAGFDLVSYQQETANFGGSGFGGNKGIIVNLSLAAITVGTTTVQAGTARDGFGYTDTLINIEGVTGTALADYMLGGDGYNYFRGWGGADTIDGGAGDRDFLSFFVDDAFFNTPGAGTIIDMVAGTAVQFQDGATATFINIEDIGGSERDDSITGDTNNNHLSGNEGNDTIDGGDGNDTISGGTGNDSLIGGAGIDFINYRFDPTEGAYYLLQRPDVTPTAWTGVTVNLATGLATDYAGNTDTISGFEGVTGTFLADSLTGDGLDNIFYGLSGNDTIDGGGGIDTINYGNSGATNGSGEPALVGINASRPNGVVVNLLGGTANDGEGGTDTLTGIENVSGSTGNDQITGNTDANTLQGRDGNDTIAGDLGSDSILGGSGLDSLSGGDGDDTIYGGMGVGDLTDADDTIDGGAGNDLIFGNAGNDSLLGGLDQDTISGESGNDTIVGDLGNDSVLGGSGLDSLSGGGGDDTIYGGIGAGDLTDADDTVDGGAGNDLIFGNSGNDSLSGGLDQDAVNGDDGNDAIFGGSGLDSLAGGNGNDTLYGGNGITDLTDLADTIGGGAGNDLIYGNSGDDVLRGGLDQDTVNGDDGNDSIFGGTGLDSLAGGNGNDTLYGGNGVTDLTDAADTIGGGAGNDLIYGNAGDDQLRGGLDQDTIFGDEGNDSILGGGGMDSLTGGTGNDTIYGGLGISDLTDAADTISGSTGNDLIYGNAGDDQLRGGVDQDTVFGDEGNDSILGGSGLDSLVGGIGNDTIYGGNGVVDLTDLADTIDGGAGNDLIYGNSGDDSLLGGLDLDTVSGDDGNDVIFGGGGVDSLTGGNGNDTIYGGNAAGDLTDVEDTIDGGAGNDLVFSGSGNDSLLGGLDQDTLNGEDGNDAIFGGSGMDSLAGGNGNDTLYGGNGVTDLTDSADTIGGGAGNDLVYGNSGDDVLRGGLDQDTVFGDDGNDSIFGGTGLDSLVGGNGNDTIYGGNGVTDLTDLADTISGAVGNDLIYGNAGDDVLRGGADQDTIFGDEGNDSILGGSGLDSLLGGVGIDTIFGDDGNDTITGGFGADQMTGGLDADQFVFLALDSVTDTITDFNVAQGDKLVFLASQFGQTFDSNPTGTAGSPTTRFIFSTNDSTLYYDADGSDPGARVAVVTLTGVTTLSSSDLLFI